MHGSKPFEIDAIELSIEFNLSNIYLLAHSRPHSSFRFDGTYFMCNSGSIDFEFLLNFNCEVFLYFDRHELSIHSIIQHRCEKPQKASEIDRIDCVMPFIGQKKLLFMSNSNGFEILLFGMHANSHSNAYVLESVSRDFSLSYRLSDKYKWSNAVATTIGKR